MPWRIGVDIGGTFTDCVAIDEDSGRFVACKVPSTPADPTEGFMRGLRRLLHLIGCRWRDIRVICHGTTVGTNAILERRGGRLALLTTEGFEDVLFIGRQKRSRMYDLDMNPETPTFLLPRARIFGVPERVAATGEVVRPLDLCALQGAVEALAEGAVDAVAVCYLFAFANPVHEQVTRNHILRRFPHLPVSLSSEVDPRFREYERLCLTLFDAYVKPIMAVYLDRLRAMLEREEFGGQVYIMHSHGGLNRLELALHRPVGTLLSGPAAGVIGARHLALDVGMRDLITCDIGGTSCDVGLVSDGVVALAEEGRIAGYPLRAPMVDVTSIGAGGGSIAWADAGGGLHVGPRSAGAEPGPACYGRGGTLPTVTDASLLLGYLNPATFAGGEVTIHPHLAGQAIGRLASEVGLAPLDAAAGIHTIVNAAMADALRLISIRRGHDPRQFTLVAFGGAGPVHAGALASLLGIRRILVPLSPGTLSAFGLLVAPIEHHAVATFMHRASELADEQLDAVLGGLARQCTDRMSQEGVPAGQAMLRYTAHMRYAGQSYELEVVLPAPREGGTVEEAVRRFHQTYERVYGQRHDAHAVEFVALRVVASYTPPPPPSPAPPSASESPPAPTSRQVHVSGAQPTPVPVYRRERLLPGHVVHGPALIEQADTTIVVPAHQVAHVDERSNLLIHVEDGP